MIDLAPRNPNGLLLRSPVIVAPGCAMAAPRDGLSAVGAIATRTSMLHTPRSIDRRWAQSPAGVIYEHVPTTGLRALLTADARYWPRSPAPILLSLRGVAGELLEMTAQLEPVEGIAGLLIEADEQPIDVVVAAVRAQTTLPLLILLPHDPDLAAIASDVVAAGADALVLCAYPSAAAAGDMLFEGVLVGPALAPLTLWALLQVKGTVDVPLVAFGGAANIQITQQYLAAGACAVMVDGALYGDPLVPQRIAMALGQSSAPSTST
jgi:hypothetical protein